MATVADLIVQQLCRAGVRALFGVPGGGSNLDLIAAAGPAGLPFVLTATETAGAIAAIAQAEITAAPGACLTTLGPGAASVVNGVACALLERTPLLVFTDAPACATRSAPEHQQIDQGALFAPVTKWSGRLSPDGAERHIERAIAVALEAPPGPVHLDCPGEAPPVVVGDENLSTTRRLDARASELERWLSQSHKPLIVVGLGARRAEDA